MNICDEIKSQISIIAYANQLGFTVIRKGKYFSLKEHDSVIIDESRNCYWRNSIAGQGKCVGRGGSIIDFSMEFENLTLRDTINTLKEQIIIPKQHIPLKEHLEIKKKELDLPQPDKNMRKVFAYLIKTRKISSQIITDIVHKKKLYQDIHGNCVFVQHDENNKPVFACLRGTNTFKPFYGDVAGCDYTYGFYLNNNSDKLYITESVIDVLSVMTLKEQNFNYLALAGVGKTLSIERYLKNDIKEVWIGTDNDEAGLKAEINIKNLICNSRKEIKVVSDRPSKYKDWNEVIQKEESKSTKIETRSYRKRGANDYFCR
jgi:hypothetical protein